MTVGARLNGCGKAGYGEEARMVDIKACNGVTRRNVCCFAVARQHVPRWKPGNRIDDLDIDVVAQGFKSVQNKDAVIGLPAVGKQKADGQYIQSWFALHYRAFVAIVKPMCQAIRPAGEP